MMEGKLVLSADDDWLTRSDVKSMLRRMVCDVIGEAVDASPAVMQIRRLRPDAVILDVRMPVMNGLTATAHLAGTLTAPVLLVSGLDYESTRELAQQVGAAGLLPKPFSDQQHAASLRRALRAA